MLYLSTCAFLAALPKAEARGKAARPEVIPAMVLALDYAHLTKRADGKDALAVDEQREGVVALERQVEATGVCTERAILLALL